jgi:hypothetical protein
VGLTLAPLALALALSISPPWSSSRVREESVVSMLYCTHIFSLLRAEARCQKLIYYAYTSFTALLKRETFRGYRPGSLEAFFYRTPHNCSEIFCLMTIMRSTENNYQYHYVISNCVALCCLSSLSSLRCAACRAVYKTCST